VDPVTVDILTEICRDIEKLLWLVEAHAQTPVASGVTLSERRYNDAINFYPSCARPGRVSWGKQLEN
jgi:hypothetical protein